MSFQSRSPGILVLLIAVGLFQTGCDLGTYGSRYSDRLPQLTERASRAAELLDMRVGLTDSEGASLGVGMRFPSEFGEETSRYVPGDLETKPNQVIPAQINLPGLQCTYESYQADVTGQRLPIYLYVLSRPVDEGELVDFQNEIVAAAGEVISDSLSWSSVELPNLDGESRSWSTMTISTSQPFVVVGEDESETIPSLEGQIRFFAKTVGGQHLVLVFRYPSQIADSLNYPLALEASVATVD